MRDDAIYAVREYGETTYFYGATAGDYQTPFDALQSILNQKQIGVYANVTTAQLIYNPEYPMDIILYDPDEDPGVFVFNRIDEHQAADLLNPNGEPASCMITLDLEQDTVHFSPNPLISNAPVSELIVRIEDGMECYQRALTEAMRTHGTDDYAEELNRLLGEQLPAVAAAWEKILGHNALYSMAENGETHYFLSDFGGGYHNPLTVLSLICNARSELQHIGMAADTPYIMRGIQYTSDMIGVDLGSVGHSMFKEIEEQKARKLLTKFDACDDIAEHVILDFDQRQITFWHGHCHPVAGEDICISFDDAADSMCRADQDADREKELPRPTVLERSLRANLRMRAGLEQAPVKAPPLESTAAVYCFVEDGCEKFFCGSAGGCGVPFAVLKELNSMRDALSYLNKDRNIKLMELMPLVSGLRLYLVEHPDRIFQTVANEQEARRMADSVRPADEPCLIITIDADNKCVNFKSDTKSFETLPTEFSVDFEDGEALLGRGVNRWVGDMDNHYPTAYDAIERTVRAGIHELLEQQEQQGPAMSM